MLVRQEGAETTVFDELILARSYWRGKLGSSPEGRRRRTNIAKGAVLYFRSRAEAVLSKCKFCQSEVDAGALKCPKCQEWLAPKNEPSSSHSDYPTLKFVADFTKATAWPAFLVVLIILFKEDVSQLLIRAKSLEIAGTKSEFVEYAAVVGYLEGKVGELAGETDPAKRAVLQTEIRETVDNLSGLHPLSLGFLISIGRGVSRDDSWGEYQLPVFELQERGFVELEPFAISPEDVTKATNARLTKSGRDFLLGIGFDNVR